ncbi:MAG TPA: hypothetical protein VKJ45_05680 [Blastocatellia bacterium]|nr:hypothetical protein [Blastocatellia bacterium]
MKKICHFSKLLYCILILAAAGVEAYAQAPGGPDSSSSRKIEPGFAFVRKNQPAHRAGSSHVATPPDVEGVLGDRLVTIMAGNLPVIGGGTFGKLTKWTGFGASNSVIGDSGIFEDKNGLVGIGTTTPTSRLTVVGVIESISGGVKFSDGTVQTTAANAGSIAISHDSTLTGNGTNGAPLGVAIPLSIVGAALDQFSTPIMTVRNNGTFSDALFVRADSATGMDAESDTGTAVRGTSLLGGFGVDGRSNGGAGVHAITDGGLAGDFQGPVKIEQNGQSNPGDLSVSGTLNVTGTKNFKIDHPLDPENKYLYHAAIESSEVLNVYSGNVVLDRNGEATIRMPEWFQALNTDFRYSLTAVGAPAAGLYVSEKIKDNAFSIAGGHPGLEVSWQVTGVRNDPVMRAHPFQVEQEKPEREKGHYIRPELFGQPDAGPEAPGRRLK